jgi:hypothetical protein
MNKKLWKPDSNWIIEQHEMLCHITNTHNEHKCPHCGTVIYLVRIENGIDLYEIFPDIKNESYITYTSGDSAFTTGNILDEDKHWQTYFNTGVCQ